jgi:hypothetical protein
MPDLALCLSRLVVVLALAVLGFGCGGGGGGAAPPPTFVAPTPTPSPPPAGALAASQSNLAFSAPGQQLSITLTEPAYGDAVSADAGGCAGIATVTPPTAPAPATFTITAQAAGACSLTFSDRFGQRAAVAIGVTVTQGTIK